MNKRQEKKKCNKIYSQADLHKLMDIIDYPIVMYKNNDNWMVIEIYDDWRE